MVSDSSFFKRYGLAWEVEPISPGVEVVAMESWREGGVEFQILEVPGHCPGSLCFFEKSERVLFGGDVLFAGGVGRWDLPGGDRDLLLGGIREKLLTLGDDVRVFPGHGPETTIGDERASNPYLR
jgi:glyoxylase-like metal-dependent hydrolase (beta-lactamase superfamily II)